MSYKTRVLVSRIKDMHLDLKQLGYTVNDALYKAFDNEIDRLKLIIKEYEEDKSIH